MSKNVWVYVDQYHGEASSASLEVIGVGRTLADKMGGVLVAMVFGQNVDALVKLAISYGADEVLFADDVTLAEFRSAPYTSLLVKLVEEGTPDTILFPTTTRGRELAAMAAADLKTGVLVDVIDLELDGDSIVATRPIYAGKLLSKVVCSTRPQMVTLRGRAFPKPEMDEGRTGTVTKVDPVMAEEEIPTKVIDTVVAEGTVSLVEAAVIVSGGRGTSNNPNLSPPADITDEKEQEIWRAQQGFKLIGELASVVRGAVGASRAAVDAGYIPYPQQVGQTGKVVSPDLYIATGISGAIQHLAGMRTSKVIVAINKDPDAPIFKLAHYGVVGDLYSIVPALTEAFKERLGK
jgi:electron transfer flavoprotein alpha subunit